MANAVRIGVQEGEGRLGFDLKEVMSAVGPRNDLRWYMSRAQFNCDVTPVWPEGTLAAEAWSEAGQGLLVDWSTMSRLAEICGQIIDGRFVGYDDHGKPQLMLEAIDSSYWVVWASNTAAIESVRRAFPAVEDSSEPAPQDEQ